MKTPPFVLTQCPICFRELTLQITSPQGQPQTAELQFYCAAMCGFTATAYAATGELKITSAETEPEPFRLQELELMAQNFRRYTI